MRVLAFDPGTEYVGWAVVDGEQLLGCGAVTFPESETPDRRISTLWWFVRDLLLTHCVDRVGIEAYTRHAGHSKRMAGPSEFLGVISAAAAHEGVPVFRCPPQQWRVALGQPRTATNAAVKRHLERAYGWKLPNVHAVAAASVAVWAGSQAAVVSRGAGS